MKVLLIVSDLFKSNGGGQTVYRNIVESTPKVEFYYFITGEALDARRPTNAHPIRLRDSRRLRVLLPPPIASHKLQILVQADQYARSVAGHTFDIVDIPDFNTFGGELKCAFEHHHVRVKRVILAMHGNISDSIRLNWGSAGNNVLEQRMNEIEQFESADGVYGISPRYITKWQTQFNRDVVYIDPAFFVNVSTNKRPENVLNCRPSLYCIGRSERRKGNDLFIELVSWLKRGSFEIAAHIGEQVYSNEGVPSGYILENISKKRDVKIDHLPAMNRAQMQSLYAACSIVVLPVRYDTLNLVALEALFAGCPIAVSEYAGVCDYLDRYCPGLPYIKIDFDKFYAAAGKLQELIDNYDQHRSILHDYLESNPHFPNVPLGMDQIYRKMLEMPEVVTSKIPYENYVPSYKELVIYVARKMVPKQTYRALRRLTSAPFFFLKNKIKKSGYLGDAKFFEVLMDSKSLPLRLKKIAEHSEYNTDRLQEKLNEIYGNASSPLYRCNFWQDIARIQRVLGNDLIAVTYELRILRLLGEDRLGLLPRVLETLRKHGFINEANVAAAMFDKKDEAEIRIYNYLKDAYRRNLVRQDRPWQVLEDHRNSGVPTVSVIVSLYNAAEKLSFFLTALCQQTLLKKGRVEIILVDSGSPINEYEVFTEYLRDTPLNAVYARSAARETIQAAWNRGIGLAKSPYLVFLGVDETLYPDALETLAGALDENSEVDWVMANSLVIAVEENGVYKHDIMEYIRDNATKDHAYLETCYLSWVGGMYRSTLHERFGFYDETFGAAGDTEFKNRILPQINVKFIPSVLGLFLNYPDGQTTVSPKAEIEDLRAWYVHRTLGGLRYAFENRTVDDAENLLSKSIGYRKSFIGYLSCDIEYATYLAQYIKSRTPNSAVVNLVLPALEQMLKQLRNLEFAEKDPSRISGIRALINAWRSASKYESQHRRALKSVSRPCYKILNDNRYEQHSHLWKSN